MITVNACFIDSNDQSVRGNNWFIYFCRPIKLDYNDISELVKIKMATNLTFLVYWEKNLRITERILCDIGNFLMSTDKVDTFFCFSAKLTSDQFQLGLR